MARLRLTCLLLVGLAWPLASMDAGAKPAVPGRPAEVSADAQATAAAAFDAELARFETISEGVERAASLAALEQLVPPGDQVRTMRYRVAVCEEMLRRDPQRALGYATSQLREAERFGDVQAGIRLRYCRGLSRGTVSMPRNALPDFDAGIALAREHGLGEALAAGLVQRGSLRSLQGDQALALEDYLEAQQLYRATGADIEAERNLINIAIAYRRMGETDQAMQYLNQSIDLARRDGNATALFTALIQTGFLHEGAGRAEATMAAFEEALRVATEGTRLRQDIAYARLGLAGALVDVGRPQDALEMLRLASVDFDAAGDASSEDFIQFIQGRANARLGRHWHALRHFNAARQLFEQAGSQRYLAMLYPERAATYEALGRPADALSDYRAYMALRKELDAQLHDQRTSMMRHRFDASRRETENAALRAREDAQRQRLDALMQARRWQGGALALGGVLLLLLAWLAVRQLRRARVLRELAATDALTGIPNRRAIEQFGARATRAAKSSGQPLAVLAFDIDHFKQVNDRHGHAAGDEVLKRVAAACQGALRPGDMVGRTGGEEFLAVLPGTRATHAARVAERLRQCVQDLSFDDVQPGLKVTVSVGAAGLAEGEDSLDAAIGRADAALYRAKQGGRNRVEPAEAEAEATGIAGTRG